MVWCDDSRIRLLRTAVTLPSSQRSWHSGCCRFQFKPSAEHRKKTQGATDLDVSREDGGFFTLFEKELICCNMTTLQRVDGTVSSGGDAPTSMKDSGEQKKEAKPGPNGSKEATSGGESPGSQSLVSNASEIVRIHLSSSYELTASPSASTALLFGVDEEVMGTAKKKKLDKKKSSEHLESIAALKFTTQHGTLLVLLDAVGAASVLNCLDLLKPIAHLNGVDVCSRDFWLSPKEDDSSSSDEDHEEHDKNSGVFDVSTMTDAEQIQYRRDQEKKAVERRQKQKERQERKRLKALQRAGRAKRVAIVDAPTMKLGRIAKDASLRKRIEDVLHQEEEKAKEQARAHKHHRQQQRRSSAFHLASDEPSSNSASTATTKDTTKRTPTTLPTGVQLFIKSVVKYRAAEPETLLESPPNSGSTVGSPKAEEVATATSPSPPLHQKQDSLLLTTFGTDPFAMIETFWAKIDEERQARVSSPYHHHPFTPSKIGGEQQAAEFIVEVFFANTPPSVVTSTRFLVPVGDGKQVKAPIIGATTMFVSYPIADVFMIREEPGKLLVTMDDEDDGGEVETAGAATSTQPFAADTPLRSRSGSMISLTDSKEFSGKQTGQLVLKVLNPDRQLNTIMLWLSHIGKTSTCIQTGSVLRETYGWDVPNATLDALYRLHQQFSAIDSSGDGNIDEDELVGALGPLFTIPSFISLFFRAFDADGNGNISFLEFTQGLSELLSENQLARLRFSFRMFDENHDGEISEDELCKVLQTLTATGDIQMASESQIRSSARRLFSLMDADDSGSILVEEYMLAVTTDPLIYDALCEIGLSVDKHQDSKVRMRLDAEDLIMIHHPDWSLTTVLLHALLVTNSQEVAESYQQHQQFGANRGGLTVAQVAQQQATEGTRPPQSSGEGLLDLEDHKCIPLSLSHHCETLMKAGALVTPDILKEFFAFVAVGFEQGSLFVDNGSIASNTTSTTARCLGPNDTAFQVTRYCTNQFQRIRRKIGLSSARIGDSFGVHNIAANMLLGTDRVLHRIHELHPSVSATGTAKLGVGTPNSFCYASPDFNLIVRSASATEVTNILKNIEEYTHHVIKHPDSIIQRYVGLYSIDQITPAKKDKQSHIFLVVCVNNFKHQSPLQTVFYLKGHGNEAFASSTGDPLLLHARDLREPIIVSEDWSIALHHQIRVDCDFLVKCGMAGYSLVIAHDEDEHHRCKRSARTVSASAQRSSSTSLRSLQRKRDGKGGNSNSSVHQTAIGKLFSCFSSCATKASNHLHKDDIIGNPLHFNEERVSYKLAQTAPGTSAQTATTGRGMSSTFGLPPWWEQSTTTGKLHLKNGGVPADDEVHTVVVNIASAFAHTAVTHDTAKRYSQKLRDFLRLVLLSAENEGDAPERIASRAPIQKVHQPQQANSSSAVAHENAAAEAESQVTKFPALRESGSRCDIVIETFHQRVTIVSTRTGKTLMSFDASNSGGLSIVRMGNVKAPQDLVLLRDVLRLDKTQPEFSKLRILKVADASTADRLISSIFKMQNRRQIPQMSSGDTSVANVSFVNASFAGMLSSERQSSLFSEGSSFFSPDYIPPKQCTIGVATILVGDTQPTNLWPWLRCAWDPQQCDVVIVTAQSVVYASDGPTNHAHWFGMVDSALIGFTCLQKWSIGASRVYMFVNANSANFVSNIEATTLAAGSPDCAFDTVAVRFRFQESCCAVVAIDASQGAWSASKSTRMTKDECETILCQQLKLIISTVGERIGSKNFGIESESDHSFFCVALPREIHSGSSVFSEDAASGSSDEEEKARKRVPNDGRPSTRHTDPLRREGTTQEFPDSPLPHVLHDFRLFTSLDDVSGKPIASRIFTKNSTHSLEKHTIEGSVTEMGTAQDSVNAPTFVRCTFKCRTPWTFPKAAPSALPQSPPEAQHQAQQQFPGQPPPVSTPVLTEASINQLIIERIIISDVRASGLKRISSVGLSTPSLIIHSRHALKSVHLPQQSHTLDPTWNDQYFDLDMAPGITLQRLLSGYLFIEAHDGMLDTPMGEGTMPLDRVKVFQPDEVAPLSERHPAVLNANVAGAVAAAGGGGGGNAFNNSLPSANNSSSSLISLTPSGTPPLGPMPSGSGPMYGGNTNTGASQGLVVADLPGITQVYSATVKSGVVELKLTFVAAPPSS